MVGIEVKEGKADNDLQFSGFLWDASSDSGIHGDVFTRKFTY